MPFSLLPRWRAESVTQITPQFLKDKNIRLIMLDFDNTVVPYTTNTPTKEVENWLQQISSEFIVCVVSNSKKNRVPAFCQRYGIACITHAKKPFSRGIRECLNRFHIQPEQAVMVGDQIYTDTLGGNCAGTNTILVRAIHNHNFWLKLRHIAELPFIFAAKNRRIENEKY